jgi:microcystin-dependent protein
MPQTPVGNTQASLALTQAFVTSGVFPSHNAGAGGAFLDEIFTFAFNFSLSGTIGANGQVLPIATNTAVFTLIGTTYGGDGVTNFAIPNLGGVTMISTGQGPGLSPEQLGVRDGASSVTLTQSQLPPDIGGTSQPFSDYQPSLPVTYMICVQGFFPSQSGGGALFRRGRSVRRKFRAHGLPAGRRAFAADQSEICPCLRYLVRPTAAMGATFALPDLRGRTIIGASAVDELYDCHGLRTSAQQIRLAVRRCWGLQRQRHHRHAVAEHDRRPAKSRIRFRHT